MAEKGLERFLNKLSPSKTTLLTALKRMDLVPSTEDREEQKTMLENEIIMFGLEAFFNEFSVRKLQSMASEMGLSVPTSSKQILVSSIVNLMDYEPPVRPKKKSTKNSTSKKKIDKKKKEDPQSDSDEPPKKKQYNFDYEFSSTDEENFVVKDMESDEQIEDGTDDEYDVEWIKSLQESQMII